MTMYVVVSHLFSCLKTAGAILQQSTFSSNRVVAPSTVYQYKRNSFEMYSCLFAVLSTHAVISSCLTVNRYSAVTERIFSKSKVELGPILIHCGLGDIVTISAPIVHTKQKIYHLTNPRSDTVRLPMNYTQVVVKKKKRKDEDYNNIIIKYVKNDPPIITPENPYRVFNVNYPKNRLYSDETNVFKETEDNMAVNDFMIGPLGEEDHGNWGLNVYFKDIDEQWIELFQVITINISEFVPIHPRMPRVNIGDTLKLGFAYPVRDLQSCELIAPMSTFDRFYDRSRIDLDKQLNNCEFIIRNITMRDQGVWSIVGVGNIVYRAETVLRVNNYKKS